MIATQFKAFLARDWRIALSYRFPFVAGLVGTVLSLTIYYFLSGIVSQDKLPKGAGREQGYFAFALIGVILVELLGVGLLSIARAIREEQTTGTLEVVAASPVRSWVIALGSAGYDLVYGLASGIVSGVLGVIVFGLRLDVARGDVLIIILAVAATLVVILALGVLAAAMTIVLKQTTVLTGFATIGLAVMSGAYYPIGELPQPLRSLSWASPLRWSLDVLRPGLFGGSTPTGELVLLVVVGLLALPLCLLVFDRALRWARRTGSLTHY